MAERKRFLADPFAGFPIGHSRMIQSLGWESRTVLFSKPGGKFLRGRSPGTQVPAGGDPGAWITDLELCLPGFLDVLAKWKRPWKRRGHVANLA